MSRKPRWAGCNRIELTKVDSTNEEAGRQALKGACHGTLVVAREQTAGQGRRGRSWYSPPGDSIYMSLLLRPLLTPDKASMLTLVMGLAAARGIRQVCHLEPAIKWPNDLLVREKKVCGILTRLQMKEEAIDSLIIGVGINVNQLDFPEEISAVATSLQRESGRAFEKTELIEEVMAAFEDCYDCFFQTGDLSLLKQEYNEGLINRGRQVRLVASGKEWTGEALGINDVGELLVRRQDGCIEQVFAGEVSVRGIYGYV